MKRQEVASSFESPIGALDSSPGRRQRQEPLRPPWVSVLTNSYPLPQHLFRVGGEGEGEGVRRCRRRRLTLRSDKHCNHNEMHDAGFGNECPPLPSSPPELLAFRRFGGRGDNIGGNADPGRRICFSLALGKFALTGHSEEAAASCRCTSRKIFKLLGHATAWLDRPGGLSHRSRCRPPYGRRDWMGWWNASSARVQACAGGQRSHAHAPPEIVAELRPPD